MSDTYNIGPVVPGLFAAHEARYKEVCDELAALRARLAAAERDATRYRWLRGGSGPQSVRWSRWSVQHWTGSFWATVQSIGMDVAIDAAMFAEQQISQSTADSATHRENDSHD